MGTTLIILPIWSWVTGGRTLSRLFVVIILGFVQGVTEFLPISSSGHLILAQRLLKVSFPGVTFEVVVHFGSLLAIVLVFWQEIVQVLRAFQQGVAILMRGKRPSFTGEQLIAWRFAWLIILGCIPTSIMGIFLDPLFEHLFSSINVVGIMLLLTGTILWSIEQKRGTGGKGIGQMKPLDALFIGFAQGCAIMPGLSRSGTTIAGALHRGLDRDTAMRYSFLLSLPTIAGASFFKLRDIVMAVVKAELTIIDYGLGLMVAAVTGVVAIKILFRVLREEKLYLFGYYCWTVGIFVLGINLFS